MAPMAQTADSQPSQTSHVELEQTTSGGSKNFQHSWTHRTDLFSTLSKYPQTLQTSNSWASVFLPLDESWNIFKELKHVQLPTRQHHELHSEFVSKCTFVFNIIVA